MKAAAILLNAALLSFVAYLFITQGMPNDEEAIFALLMVLAPLFSLFALRERDDAPAADDARDDAPSLLTERRQLRAFIEAAQERLDRVDTLVEDERVHKR